MLKVFCDSLTYLLTHSLVRFVEGPSPLKNIHRKVKKDKKKYKVANQTNIERSHSNPSGNIKALRYPRP